MQAWAPLPVQLNWMGIRSADPKLVPTAGPVNHLSQFEAEELARLGRKVLHPKTMEPLKNTTTPIWVRCTAVPQFEGSQIAPRTASTEPRACVLIRLPGIEYLQLTGRAVRS